MFIGIFMLPFYMKYLGAESYGLVGFFTMLVSWMLLLDMGFSQALSREAAKLKDKCNGLLEIKLTLRSVESLIVIISIFIFILVFISSNWISLNWLQVQQLPHEKIEQCIKLMGLMISLKWFISLYSGLVLGFEEQVWLNVYKVSISTLRFVGGLLLIIYITNDIFYYFAFQAILSILELMLIKSKIYNILPSTSFLFPSIKSIKSIGPFALGLAYTSGMWIVFTQLDKLLLSHYIALSQYGYFTLVIVISAAIMQFSAPLSQALLPRMTSLLSNNNEKIMLNLYRKGTKYVSILVFSTVGIIALYPYELLYSWTGNVEASVWASPVLFWYVISNAILAVSAFQYYLQFAHGNLKYHIRFNTYFPIFALPIIFYAVSNYGAVGAGVAWFIIQLIGFIVWPPFIHRKFARGIHLNWLVQDILPALFGTFSYIFILKYVDIDFGVSSRVEIISVLIGLGIILLFINLMLYSDIRRLIIRKIYCYVKYN